MIPLILTLVLHAPLPIHTSPIGHTPKALPQAMCYAQGKKRKGGKRR